MSCKIREIPALVSLMIVLPMVGFSVSQVSFDLVVLGGFAGFTVCYIAVSMIDRVLRGRVHPSARLFLRLFIVGWLFIVGTYGLFLLTVWTAIHLSWMWLFTSYTIGVLCIAVAVLLGSMTKETK